MRRVADEADSTRYHCPGSLLVKLDRQEPKLFKCIAQVLCGLGLTLSHPFRADVVGSLGLTASMVNYSQLHVDSAKNRAG